MSWRGSALRSLAAWQTASAHRRFVADARDPDAAQRRVWRETAALLRNSPFWRGRLQSRLASHPVTTFDDYREALDASIATGVSVLNGEAVRFWSQSAGTTGRQKLFPMTASFRRQFQRTVRPMVHGLLGRYPRFLREPVLYFAATNPVERAPGGVEIGFISNYNYRTIPALLRRQYVWPAGILGDAAAFDRLSVLYAAASDLSAMFAVTPLSLSRFAANLRTHGAWVVDVLRGRESWPAGWPRRGVHQERAAHVEGALGGAVLSFKALWPSLAFVCVWKTAICAAHLHALAEELRGVDILDAIYSATEGWMTVPVPGVGNVVHPGAHVMEFVEAGTEPSAGALLPPAALEAGRSYEVFLTTAMGLVRYRLFDVVRCTGFFHRAPIIEFAHKSGGIISLGLVAVGEDELAASLLAAGLRVDPAWRVGPDRDGTGLVLFVDAAVADLDTRLAAADAHLRALNINYGLYTANGTFRPWSARVLPPHHPLWQRAASHAQSKPVLLLQSNPE